MCQHCASTAGGVCHGRRADSAIHDYVEALGVPWSSGPGCEQGRRPRRLADALGGLLDGLGQDKAAPAPLSWQDYTAAARAAIQAAAIAEHDFAGWLAAVAAGLGSSAALVQGRPGSWEAADVLHLVRGTVGQDDEYLDGYRAGDRATLRLPPLPQTTGSPGSSAPYQPNPERIDLLRGADIEALWPHGSGFRDSAHGEFT